MRRIPCTLALAGLCLAQAQSKNYFEPTHATTTVTTTGLFGADEIKSRFKSMKSPVTPVYDADVEAYLLRYLTYGARETEAILGRAQVYLPVVEQYLVMNGMPSQLKYLPMVESELVPYAVSTRGAAGLWQFVAATGQELGLVINDHLDERKDPYKSTEAGVRYLKQLYQRFGSWNLALVAYNCGPSRLQRAIQEAGSQDYAKVKPFLPKESQRYLARYLAAAYTGSYGHLHWLSPALPDFHLMNSVAAKVYSKISLRQIAQLTGLDLATLRRLNPSFKKNLLPASIDGVFLVLPRESWKRYLNAAPNRP